MIKNDLPSVTIVIPARNESKYIISCLESLRKQDYPKSKTEIFIIDGNSEDNTKELVGNYVLNFPDMNINLLDNPQRISSVALNLGIKRSSNEIIVWLSSHAIIDEFYISNCIKAFQKSGADSVGGPMIPVGDTVFGKAVSFAMAHPIGVGNAKFHYSLREQFVETVFMAAFKKNIFKEVGLFDENLVHNQDYEMNVRIVKAGKKIFMDPNIKSLYIPRNTPIKLWNQYFKYGWWKVQTLRRHPTSLRLRQIFPPLFVLLTICISLLPFFSLFRGLPFFFFSIYFSTILLTILLSYKKIKEYSTIPFIPIAIIIIHFAWGIGFLTNFLSTARFPYKGLQAKIPTC